jgi:probable phosphoglycerate mutase
MLLYLLRHAEPIYEPDSITEYGKKQAEALAKRLSLYGVDEIYSSSSNRAVETARPTSIATGKKIEILDFANEKHLWKDFSVLKEDGTRQWCFEDKSFIEFFQTREIRALGDKWYTHRAFIGSNYKEGIERVERASDCFLEKLGYRHDRIRGTYESSQTNCKRVAFFAHHGFGIAFLSAILDIPFPMMSTHFYISHTGMTVIHFSDTPGICVPKVLCLSSDAHLYREGMPTKYKNQLIF